MATSITDSAALDVIAGAQHAANGQRTKTVMVDGQKQTIQRPFPSPVDWRDCWIYFLLIDRFNNTTAPKRPWNQRWDLRQGGTFKGVQAQLGYLQNLGVKAIWLSPILKNSNGDGNYHGYGAQDFLNLDARFASDGKLATAERELTDLVDEAHARGMYVIQDIVLNHAGRVFDYVTQSGTTDILTDPNAMNGPLGSEPAIQWLNGYGYPRSDWQNRLDPPENLSADDAVWPTDLQNHLLFRRRGSVLSHTPDWRGFVAGDFSSLRQLVLEYDGTTAGQETLRAKYGPRPVLDIVIRAYTYLMARYDLDGFRIDTVKYVRPDIVETFGNAMREYALSMGKANFFMFGEVWDNEDTISKFVGRNGAGEGFGIDAAADFPLFYLLPSIAKGFADVGELRAVFQRRKNAERELLSSHGEAGRYFVSFLDNHDQTQRFHHPQTPAEQVKLGLTLLFALQGIPCVYYGTEQGLTGAVDANGAPDLSGDTSVREALWGKQDAFSTSTPMYRAIQRLSKLRKEEPALAYGRLYFREVSGNGIDFGYSQGAGGIVAFSRILGDHEVLVAANTGSQEFNGMILMDRDLNASEGTLNLAYSSTGSTGTAAVRMVNANIYGDQGVTTATIAAAAVRLAAHEAQVIAPLRTTAPRRRAAGA